MDIIRAKEQMVEEVGKLEAVKGIGQTGDPHKVPVAGQSDIDLFVLCTKVPSYEARINTYEKYKDTYTNCMMEVCNGGLWGVGDILIMDGVEVMFMYFTIQEMSDYLKEVLAGKYLEKEGGFYPIGRLATIFGMHVLYEEENTWEKMKQLVAVYPKDLAVTYFKYHISRILNEEDLGRSVLRKDVFFYHMVLEEALDHFLQALYAVNGTYFPSRKRSKQYIETFSKAPVHCYERLLQMVTDSVNSQQIEASVKELRMLTEELNQIGEEWL